MAEQEPETAIAKTEEAKSQIASAKSLNDLPLSDTAKALMTSGLVKSGEDLGRIFAKLSLGRDLGLPAVSSINGIGITPQGAIIFSSALMRLLINRSGKYRLFVKQRDIKGSSIEVFEKNDVGEWILMGVPVSFTAEDAKRAKLDTKETYIKYPVDMYYARAIAAAFRTYCPDCAAGCAVYLPEEIDGSGFKTDPATGDAVPEAEYEVKPKRSSPVKKPATVSPESLNNIKKLLVDTKSDERVFLNHYQCESLDKLKPEQQTDLEQKLTQKKAAQKC